MARILVVEDEKDLIRLLKYNLEKEGYNVLTAGDGEAGLQIARREKPDFVILDLMLPKLDGIAVCQALRQDSAIPILMLTAKKEEVDRVLGLELGADDYLTKPFSVRELLARIKSILRRTQAPGPVRSARRFGQLSIDFDRYVVTVKDKTAPVSAKEFEFLRALIEARGKALTRDQLLERVWGQDPALEIDTRTIDQHIARLRDKLGPEAGRLVTVKNVGYRFEM
jgi:two-component system, OmpR family, alkaline phosphatase synthesis response regulator PhoP